ncbi:MAG: hypothetical protein ACI87E_000093 [Mariniblastus sp.]|jgi:hypothetical protein
MNSVLIHQMSNEFFGTERVQNRSDFEFLRSIQWNRRPQPTNEKARKTLSFAGFYELPLLDAFRTFFRSPPVDFRLRYRAFQEWFKVA